MDTIIHKRPKTQARLDVSGLQKIAERDQNEQLDKYEALVVALGKEFPTFKTKFLELSRAYESQQATIEELRATVAQLQKANFEQKEEIERARDKKPDVKTRFEN
jgi:uncharacterized protein YPO0396